MPTFIANHNRAAPMENTITTTATIIAPYSDIFEATLPNGKKTLAHFSRATAHLREQIAIGMTVTVELTPFDFDVARIVAVPPVATDSSATATNPADFS